MNKIAVKQFELLERRVEALRLWRLGYSLREVATKLEIDLHTAWDDVEDARARLRAIQDLTIKDRRQDAWLEQQVIKTEALREWEKSKQETLEITEEPDPEDPERMVVKRVRRIQRHGDPRYLAIAQAAEKRQAELYGTDQDPKSLDLFGQDDENDDGSTVRGNVVGRDEADARQGARFVELPALTGPEDSPQAPEVALPKADRPVRKRRANKGVRRGSRVRKD